MNTFFAQLCTIGAVGAFFLAGAWIDGEPGLHPFASLPLATVLLLAPYFTKEFFSDGW